MQSSPTEAGKDPIFIEKINWSRRSTGPSRASLLAAVSSRAQDARRGPRKNDGRETW